MRTVDSIKFSQYTHLPTMRTPRYTRTWRRLGPTGGEADLLDSLPEHVSSEALVALFYVELQKLAAALMKGEREGHTLSRTALVNEAYIRLASSPGAPVEWNCKAHFFGAAAIAMRRVLVEHARRRGARKRGGGQGGHHLPLPEGILEIPNIDLIALDEAMTELHTHSKAAHDTVMYRFFAGLSREQTAAIMDVDPRTVTRHWNAARVWLHSRLDGPDTGPFAPGEPHDNEPGDE